MNLGVAIHNSARRAPEAVAVFDEHRELSYRELDERTSRLAHALRGMGVARGDRVALLAPNRREVVEVLGGCAKAGVVYCGLNFRLGEEEYRAILENAEPALIVCGHEHAELADRLGDAAGVPVLDVDDDGPRGYEALLAAAPAALPSSVHDVRPEDDFCLVYTSGTTGRPKGVLFDVRAVMQHATVALVEFELDARSRWLMALPHNSSLQITLAPLLLVGGAVGFTESRGFDAKRFVADVRRHRASHTYLVPTMLFRLLEGGVGADDVPTLHTIGYGAAPIPPERVRELVERFGPRFTQLYGMAEVASIATMLRKDDHARALDGEEGIFASCGRASYAMDVRVIDGDGRDVAPGERGEVVFGSPYTMRGYHRDPERTAEVLRGGWMHSGDVGEIDEVGYVYVVDRMKDLIIRGGFNVVPSEVENALYSHPAVLEAAVVGVPDPEWGEAVVAFVSLRQTGGSRPTSSSDGAATWSCRASRSPRASRSLTSCPRTPWGKIAKGDLRERVSPSSPDVR